MLSLTFKHSYKGVEICRSLVVECNGSELESAIIGMLLRKLGWHDWEVVHTKEWVYRVFSDGQSVGYVFVQYCGFAGTE